MRFSHFSSKEGISLKNEDDDLESEKTIDFVAQSYRQPKFQSKEDFLTELKLSFQNFSTTKIIAFLLIGVILLWLTQLKSSEPQNSKQTEMQEFSNSVELSETESNIQRSEKDEEEQESFQLDFVETQYEGKQTEAKLTKKVFAAMQKKFNIQHRFPTESELEEQEITKLLEDISTLEIMIPDRTVPEYVAQNFYFFSVSIHDMILNSELYKLYRNGQTIYKISLKQHMRAIIRTQLVHSVTFKGEIKPELSPFDKGMPEKIKAIRQIIDDEELYYESFYELSKYNVHQLRFCIVVPSYKNVKSKLYLRNLDSIFMQDYQNYHVVYVDDASPDRTGEYVKRYLEEKQIPPEKIQVFINDVNKKAMFNIYHHIHKYCPDGEVVGLIDGDDSFLGRKVFQLYNAVYQAKRPAVIYSNFLKILTNNKTSFGFGTELSRREFESGQMRNSMSLVGTHFMTFFSDVFKKIKMQDLCYDNGTFYDYAYDRAIITPMIEMAFPRVEYLAEVTYEYRNDTGINDGTENWERVSRLILAKPAYKQLDDFSFIDKFVDETEKMIKAQEQHASKSSGTLEPQIKSDILLQSESFPDLPTQRAKHQDNAIEITQQK